MSKFEVFKFSEEQFKGQLNSHKAIGKHTDNFERHKSLKIRRYHLLKRNYTYLLNIYVEYTSISRQL